MSRIRRPDPVQLAITRDLLESVAEEMAAVCIRTSVSPNIKDRRDLSAAVFDAAGVMVAHAAHIPVHLGAMPASVRAVVEVLTLGPQDVALVNDPFAGGTHLPDITAVRGVFGPGARAPVFYVAVRAHHADVGGAVPGSMAPMDDFYAEGLRIPPVVWVVAGVPDPNVERLLFANMRDPEERRADLAAQAGALQRGARRLVELAAGVGGMSPLAKRSGALVNYAARLARHALQALPDGEGRARVLLEIDGVDGRPARIAVALRKRGASLEVNFDGTTGPVGMGLNAPEAVTRSAIYYFVRCLCPSGTPTNDGLLAEVDIRIPAGCLLAAELPAPVAGGNVETSQRIVDALWLAASRMWPGRMPAPGSGTMSNWTFGRAPHGPAMPSYYETLPGGAGGGPQGPGASAVQQHMTNTRGTPIEVLEALWPVRVERLALRRASGGAGRQPGGLGLVRVIRFLAPATVSVMMTRHVVAPPGVRGGGPGAVGRVRLLRAGRLRRVEPRGQLDVAAGEALRIETPGGGGFGRAP